MRKWLITVAFGVGVFLVGGAFAAIPGADGRIHACYTKLGGDTRIVDEAAACKARENRVTWSQTGPQGPKGDKGDPGPSHAHIARNSSVALPSNVVASLTVPAGTYVINGKAVLIGTQADTVSCLLSTGDFSLGKGPVVTLPVQDSATFGTQSTVTMSCGATSGVADAVVLTAIAVGGIN